MELRHRLFDLRRKAGLSQEELADVLGVTRQAVQKWESGASKPDMENLCALARHFQVTLDYLVLGKEPDEPSTPAPTVVNHYYNNRARFEFKSKRTLFGLPLVHVCVGGGLCWARGILAVGQIATGVFALGGIAVGLFSLGGISLALLLALGGLALGGAAVGGLAIGLIAWGGAALGLLSVGGVALGVYAAGGVALGAKVAIGNVASAPLAIGFAADGAQTLPPMDPAAAKEAIAAACQNAPQWLCRLLQFFAGHLA